MIRQMIHATALALLFTLAAGQLAYAAPPDQAAPAAPPPPTANAPADEGALPSPDQLWDVTMLRCKNWIDAAGDDRAAVGMFYYGWLAGARGIHALRPAAIQPNLHKVLEFCARHRDTTIVKAFQAALPIPKGE